MIEKRGVPHKTILAAAIAFVVLTSLYVGLYFARSHYGKYGDPPLQPGQAWTGSNFWIDGEELSFFEKDCRRFPTDIEVTLFSPLVYIESQVRGHEILVETWNFDFALEESEYHFDSWQ